MPLELARRIVTFTVAGLPQPKGSTKAFVPLAWAREAAAAGKAPRAIVTSDNPDAENWQQLIASQAQAAAEGVLFVGPITVAVIFRLPRPASAPRRIVHHCTKPDIDKLARACLDALTGVVFADDKAVIDLRARKVFASPASPPGAEITVGEAVAPEPAHSSFDLFREDAV
jgi:Holliday junction resolvase RusA-like endonuclease